MVQRRGGSGLPLKPVERLPVAGHAARKKLERDVPAESKVFGTVDDAHAAVPKLLEDPVVGNGPANHDRDRLRIQETSPLVRA
jgi:hypothetical protein